MTNQTPELQPTPEDNPAPADQPAIESAPEPATDTAAEPAIEAVAAEPAFIEAPEPPIEATTEPVMESSARPAIQPVLQPAREPASEPASEPVPEPSENFGELLAAFEKSHAHAPQPGRQIQGAVISIDADQVFLDIGFKIEGVLPRSSFENNAEAVKPGDTVPVSVTGRNEEGYYTLTRFKVAQPRDWSALEQAFAQKLAVVGTVTGQVKGGLNVDVGVRAFMPASRSGARDAAEMEALVGQQINCRITKLDVTDEDVVVDRRVVLEEQARAAAEGHFGAMKEGDILTGTVRSLMSYGAFVDIGGVDGLLHVSDMAWTRVNKPDDVVSVGQDLQVKILKIDPDTKKISLGLKQLQPEPWETVPGALSGRSARARPRHARGRIRRIRRARARRRGPDPHLRDVVGQKDSHRQRHCQAGRNRRRRHPRHQARGAPHLSRLETDPHRSRGPKFSAQFPVGSQVEGPVTKLMKFGAFVQIAEGVEGLVHISEIVRRSPTQSSLRRAPRRPGCQGAGAGHRH